MEKLGKIRRKSNHWPKSDQSHYVDEKGKNYKRGPMEEEPIEIEREREIKKKRTIETEYKPAGQHIRIVIPDEPYLFCFFFVFFCFLFVAFGGYFFFFDFLCGVLSDK